MRLARKVKPIPGTLSWNVFIRQGKGTFYQSAPYEKQKPAIMVFSSGTTGASKGIQLTNDGINATMCEYECGGFSFKRQDILFRADSYLVLHRNQRDNTDAACAWRYYDTGANL